VSAQLRAAADDRNVARRAQAFGVAIQTLSMFRVSTRSESGLVLGYSAIQNDDLAVGIRRIRRCLEEQY
jgi:DNA-binding transcriptional MocR family regulator